MYAIDQNIKKEEKPQEDIKEVEMAKKRKRVKNKGIVFWIFFLALTATGFYFLYVKNPLWGFGLLLAGAILYIFREEISKMIK